MVVLKTFVSCTTFGRYAPGRHTRRLSAQLLQCKVGQSRRSHFFHLPFAASPWHPPAEGDRGAPIVSNLLPCRTGPALCTPWQSSSFFRISWQFLPTSCQLLSRTVSIASIRRAPVYSFFPGDTIHNTWLLSRRQGWRQRSRSLAMAATHE